MFKQFKINHSFKAVIIITLILSTSGCVLLGGENSSTTALNGGTNPSDLLIVSEHNRSGESPQFFGSAYIPINAMQTFDAEIHFPMSFSFNAKGFLHSGPAGTSVGSYSVDINDDGIPEISFPIKAESTFFAWVDFNNNQIKDFSEAEIFQSENFEGEKLLFINIPNGGDNNPSINHGDSSFRMKITINAGLIINPALAENHLISAIIHSVDPDTGGANNGAGTEPEETLLISDLIVDTIFVNHFE